MGCLFQKSGPIYRDPVDKGFFNAQFYAPTKRFFRAVNSNILGEYHGDLGNGFHFCRHAIF